MTLFQRHATQAIVIALCAVTMTSCQAPQGQSARRVPTSDALVFNPQQFWITSHCGTVPITDSVYVDLDREHPRFRVLEAMHRHVWLKCMSVHFEPDDYPIAVLTYRAQNVLKKDYLLWMDDTRGPMRGGIVVFETEDMILDGQVHELRQDLRELNPAGKITMAWIAVQADETGDAYVDLIDLRFVADPDAKPKPIAVRIVDESGKPIPGATVTVDSEFINLSRCAVTDSDGRVSITPVRPPAGSHMLRVSAEGYVTIESHGKALPSEIALSRAATYGGRVVDEQGKPVANVAVHLGDWQRDQARLMHLPIKALTDADGCWQSPPLPASLDKLKLRFHHAQYVSSQEAEITGTDLNAAREQRYNFTIKRGSTVRGKVTDPDGAPAVGAKVTIGRQTVYTDAQGVFIAQRVEPGEQTVTIIQPGFAVNRQSVTVEPATASVAVLLDAGRTLSGRVVNSDGNPVEGAVVLDTGRNLEFRTHTDADGRFTWQGAPSEPVFVDAYHADHGRAQQQAMNDDGDTVVRLTPQTPKH